MLTPWDLPVPNTDDPSPRVVPMIPPLTIARAARDEVTRRAIEARLNRVDLYECLARGDGAAANDSRRRSVFDWLADHYGESPRGLLWLCGTLLPIAAAIFALAYFGARLAVSL